jgi:hypothetical protein
LFGAAAALAGHAQFAPKIAEAACAALDAVANLAIGDAMAETDVHGCFLLPMIIRPTSGVVNGIANHSYYYYSRYMHRCDEL